MNSSDLDAAAWLGPIEDPFLQQLRAYWDAKRGDRFAPARRDIDPLELPFLLGNIALLDVIHEPALRFRYRVHGTNLSQASGVEMTGRYLDEFPQPEYRDVMLAIVRYVVETRGPWQGLLIRRLDGNLIRVVGLVMPLSEDGQTVSMTLGASRNLPD